MVNETNEQVTTVVLSAGTPAKVKFAGSYPYFWICNNSDSEVYAAIDGTPEADADGTYTVAAGEKLRISGGAYNSSLTLLGEGKVQVIASGIATPPFVVPKKGGEAPEIYSNGIVGYFDTESVNIAAEKWYNKIDSSNDIVISGGTIEDNAYKALGGDIDDFACADIPKVIYIVLKKNASETDACIIGGAKVSNNSSTGFAIWQGNVRNYNCSQTGAPYIADLSAAMGVYHCFAIARQSAVNTNGDNGLMFFCDGKMIGFLNGNKYSDYKGFITILRYFDAKEYNGLCATDTYIRAMLIGTQEHNIQQILQNCNYLQNKYM